MVEKTTMGGSGEKVALNKGALLGRIAFYLAILIIFCVAFPVLGMGASPSVIECEGVHVDISKMAGAEDARVSVSTTDEIYPSLESSVGSENFVLRSFNLAITRPGVGDIEHITGNFGSIGLSFALPAEYSKARLFYLAPSGFKSTEWEKGDDGFVSFSLTAIGDAGTWANMALVVDGSERGLIVKRESAISDLNSYVSGLNKSEYSESGWDWIEVYAASGEKSIRIAASDEAIDGALMLAKTNISAVAKAGPETGQSDEAQDESNDTLVQSDKEKDEEKSSSSQSKQAKTPKNPNPSKTPTPSPTPSPAPTPSVALADAGEEPIEMDEGDIQNMDDSEMDPLAEASDGEMLDEADSSQEDIWQRLLKLGFLTDWRFLGALLGLVSLFLLAEFIVYLVQRHRLFPRKVAARPETASEPVASTSAPDYKMGALATLMSEK